ncbi:hypothetical protein C0991_000164 [Blastosporella zonata]|nr:hypothetical protein C0991_000164 [Blastosporella zonata]
MPTKALKTLKAGLANLLKQTKARQELILKALNDKKPVSDADEHWLDHEGNHVDEEKVLETLENASNYKRRLERLDSGEKQLVKRLSNLATGIEKKLAGNKRKCPENHKIVPPGDKKKKPLVFTKKQNASVKQKIEILDWHHAQGPKFSQSKTVAYWDPIYPNLCIKQPLVSAWLKDEEKI